MPNTPFRLIQDHLHTVFKPFEKHFHKNEEVLRNTTSSGNREIFARVNKGIVCLVTINSENERRILHYFEAGDYFSSAALHAAPDFYYFIARSACDVTMWTAESYSIEPSKELLQIRAYTLEQLHLKSLQHLSILAQHTMRNKILHYITLCHFDTKKGGYDLPFSFSDLADYIYVDRSSLMREVGKMKDDGIIRVTNRFVRITN